MALLSGFPHLHPSWQEKLQKALERLDEVQEMFGKRQASLKKLSAKQARPVQPVAPHPESSPKHPPGTSKVPCKSNK